MFNEISFVIVFAKFGEINFPKIIQYFLGKDKIEIELIQVLSLSECYLHCVPSYMYPHCNVVQCNRIAQKNWKEGRESSITGYFYFILKVENFPQTCQLLHNFKKNILVICQFLNVRIHTSYFQSQRILQNVTNLHWHTCTSFIYPIFLLQM